MIPHILEHIQLLEKIAAFKQEAKNLKYKESVAKIEISDPFAKLEEEIQKLNLKETPAKFFENIYVTRNRIAFRKLYLKKESELSEPQIDQVLDPVKVLLRKNSHMPSPSAFSKFVLSVLKFLGILKSLSYTQNILGVLK